MKLHEYHLGKIGRERFIVKTVRNQNVLSVAMYSNISPPISTICSAYQVFCKWPNFWFWPCIWSSVIVGTLVIRGSITTKLKLEISVWIYKS